MRSADVVSDAGRTGGLAGTVAYSSLLSVIPSGGGQHAVTARRSGQRENCDVAKNRWAPISLSIMRDESYRERNSDAYLSSPCRILCDPWLHSRCARADTGGYHATRHWRSMPRRLRGALRRHHAGQRGGNGVSAPEPQRPVGTLPDRFGTVADGYTAKRNSFRLQIRLHGILQNHASRWGRCAVMFATEPRRADDVMPQRCRGRWPRTGHQSGIVTAAPASHINRPSAA